MRPIIIAPPGTYNVRCTPCTDNRDLLETFGQSHFVPLIDDVLISTYSPSATYHAPS